MKKLFLLIVFSSFIAPLFSQGPPKGPLDRKYFRVDLVKVKDEKEKLIKPPDDLKFFNGKFKSNYFYQWGFKNALYQATLKDSAAQAYDVVIEAKNDIKEVMTWNIKVVGDDIEGSTELVDKKGEVKYNYTFTGMIKSKYGKEK